MPQAFTVSQAPAQAVAQATQAAEAAQAAAEAARAAAKAARGVQVINLTPESSPKAIYDALRNARREIVNQIEDVESARQQIASQLRQPNLSDADKAGLQGRLATLDARLKALDQQRADADAAVAKQAAVPGSIVQEQPRPRTGPPDEVYFLTGMFFVIVLLPLSIAYARRIWRRGAPEIPKEVYDRFTRVEQSLDTIAIEVERVGEGQRFLTRMQSEQANLALGAGAAERVESAGREKLRDARK